jgi:hypothetical protein
MSRFARTHFATFDMPHSTPLVGQRGSNGRSCDQVVTIRRDDLGTLWLARWSTRSCGHRRPRDAGLSLPVVRNVFVSTRCASGNLLAGQLGFSEWTFIHLILVRDEQDVNMQRG